MLRYLTAGESHGPCLTAILCGYPAGVDIDISFVNNELVRRQKGYGRGPRMKIEKDKVEITSGIRFGKTIGSPITIVIENKDWKNWRLYMSLTKEGADHSRDVALPRPGHGDLAGALKYHHKDIRNVLERASARETAARVAIGAFGKLLLNLFDICIFSHTLSVGEIKAEVDYQLLKKIANRAEKSVLRCADAKAEKKMIAQIDKTREEGDTLGGIIEVIATGVPVGLGSYANHEERLDGMLASALMSIPAIKGVEIGLGFAAAGLPGSQVHDGIFYAAEKKDIPAGFGPSAGFYRKTNHAGGIESGVTNGAPIIVRAAMKPIPTLAQPLKSVDLISKSPGKAQKERADVCAVSAAGVVAEAAVAFVLARAFLLKFGHDSIEEIKTNFQNYLNYLDLM